jgi:hypothetical protein
MYLHGSTRRRGALAGAKAEDEGGSVAPPAAIPPAAAFSTVSVFLRERSCGSLAIAPRETGNHGATDIPFGDRPTGTFLRTLSDFTSMTETVFA